MSQERVQELGSSMVGMIMSVSIGSFLFEAIGALVIGIIGAFGGYLFQRLIKPKLEELGIFKKKEP